MCVWGGKREILTVRVCVCTGEESSPTLWGDSRLTLSRERTCRDGYQGRCASANACVKEREKDTPGPKTQFKGFKYGIETVNKPHNIVLLFVSAPLPLLRLSIPSLPRLKICQLLITHLYCDEGKDQKRKKYILMGSLLEKCIQIGGFVFNLATCPEVYPAFALK